MPLTDAIFTPHPSLLLFSSSCFLVSRRYPKFQNFPLQYYHKVRQWDYDVQWGFGAGLHYTTFNYTKLTVTPTV